MSKKKKFILIVAGIIILISILIVIIGISKKITIKNNIKKDIESTLSCIINNDFSDGFYYINIYGYRLSSINTTEFDKLVANQVKFKIKNIETKNDEAIVRIEVQYPDLTKDLSKLQTENYYDTIYNADSITKELDLYLLKSDNHWTLLQNSELFVYRNKLLSENAKNTSSDNIAQSLSSTSSNGYFENFYDKPITDENIALDSIEVNRTQLGYDDENLSFEFMRKDEYMGASYRFKILYKGIPLNSEEVRVLVDENGNARTLISRKIPIKLLEKISTTPKITEDEALNIAKETLGEDFLEYNLSANFKQVKISPELVIYEINDKYFLSYYIQSGSYICIVDAESGDVITANSTEMSNTAEFEGQNGDIHQVFYDDYKDENYDIKNALWNSDKGLFIFDNCIDNISLNHIFTLDDIKDGSNKSAVDGMANTYRVIEYFEQENLSLSFDNTWVIVNNDKSKDENGKSRKNNATGGVLFVENQSVAKITFDIRSDKNKAQLSAYLDVVAHEYTHAVTGLIAFGSSGYSSDCKYFERNALAEAYSDIFGQLVEQKYTGKTDWIQSVPENNRSLKSPNRSKYTKRYTTEDKQGTDSNDYGGAHKNSTIISHTAYLMSKDNHNENYDSEFLLDYNQLGQLWYGSLFYLNDKSDFSDCRYAVEESARDLIENGVLLENNLKVIEQAFNEVEVSSNPTRRGLTDSMEIIKDKNTIVVPIEDETQSTEFVEITEAETTIETFVNCITMITYSFYILYITHYFNRKQ